MASTSNLLRLQLKSPRIPSPSFTHFFSSAPSNNDTPSDNKKSSIPPTTTGTPNPPSKMDIGKRLAEFRTRAAAPQPISFQEIYKRNVIHKGPNNNTTTGNQPPGGRNAFDAIRNSLLQLKASSEKNQAGGVGQANDSRAISRLTDTLKHRPMDPNGKGSSFVIGGSGDLPLSVFGKELRDKEGSDRYSDTMNTEFVKIYNYKDLGEKLKVLRPENKGKNWFTLQELNDRLIKMRQYEDRESQSRTDLAFKDLRLSLAKLKEAESDKKKSSTMQRLDVLGQIGGTPSFMLSPPKEHLIENYFHPDNMSSAEKLKLELKKVRDEFKMSESDCGSFRVQVALLTTKIKHLSTALHKKDKHSRKGLMAMIQRRKKLLKYLRRTDWDSYCLVLSKLGLRDNPDYKALA